MVKSFGTFAEYVRPGDEILVDGAYAQVESVEQRNGVVRIVTCYGHTIDEYRAAGVSIIPASWDRTKYC